jgi:leader peptidase (prepilin peptidase)/N-methyltransferase
VTDSGTSLQALVIPVAAVVGLFVGSFLNVVVYRTPLHLSVSTPRSFCPTCDRQLAWWENVPLLSWLFLRGRCHTCHGRISARYPLVEATTSLIFALVAWAWHGSLPTAGYCVLAATAFSIALIEYGGQRSPLSVGAAGTGLGALLLVPGLLVVHHDSALVRAFVGLAIGGVIFGILRVRDPDCRSALHHGRTALPLVGLWLGGLGWRPTVSGLAAWVLASFACMVTIRLFQRGDEAEGSVGRTARSISAIATVPLVSGIIVALAVSLGVAA